MSVVETIGTLTDPVTAVLIGGLWFYLRRRLMTICGKIDGLRGRVNRLESSHITDGGRSDERL